MGGPDGRSRPRPYQLVDVDPKSLFQGIKVSQVSDALKFDSDTDGIEYTRGMIK